MFFAGAPHVLDAGPRVSIVGSRKPSTRGLNNARGLATWLVRRGAVVVSGLAEGIDTAAHLGAIDAGGKTRWRARNASRQELSGEESRATSSPDEGTSGVGADVPLAKLLHGAKPKTVDGAAIIASVAQGRQLRLDADALGLNVNSGFDDLLIFDSKASALNMGAKLRFTVLGPRQAELDKLEAKWRKEVKALLKEKAKSRKADTGGAELGAQSASSYNAAECLVGT